MFGSSVVVFSPQNAVGRYMMSGMVHTGMEKLPPRREVEDRFRALLLGKYQDLTVFQKEEAFRFAMALYDVVRRSELGEYDEQYAEYLENNPYTGYTTAHAGTFHFDELLYYSRLDELIQDIENMVSEVFVYEYFFDYDPNTGTILVSKEAEL